VCLSLHLILSSDSTSAISIAWDPVKHELTEHIGVDAFYMRSHCEPPPYAFRSSASGFLHRGINTCPIDFCSPNSVF
jgi:hypothetical protein